MAPRPGVSARASTIPRPLIRRVRTNELSPHEVGAIRDLLWAAFEHEGGFTEEDWEHALGGVHVIAEEDGRIVAHASVVERTLRIGETPLRTGYVEAVATAPDQRGSGLGTHVMEEVGSVIRDGYELGALGTGAHHFYERLGWETWSGRAFVQTPSGSQRTPDEEGYIMILRTPTTPALKGGAPIVCDWRRGDVW